MYTIIFDKSAEKDLDKLPRTIIKRVIGTISNLAKVPRPHGIKKLKGSTEDLYRVRCGDYRVIYSIEDVIKIVNIKNVRHRKDIYRAL
jgi:mRNA interferase RelE/StbE